MKLHIEAGNWLLRFLTLRPVLGFLLIFGVAVSFIRISSNKQQLMLPLAIMSGFFAFALFSGPDWMPHHRFIAPIAPLMALFVAVALDAPKRPVFGMSMAVLAVIAIGFEVSQANTLYKPFTDKFGHFTDGLVQAGKCVNRNTSKTATIATSDAGAIAYYAVRTTIDMDGLNDVHIAHSSTKSDVEYVLAHHLEIIQLHVGFTESGDPLAPTGGILNQHILDLGVFHDCYVPDLARPSDPYYPFRFLRTCD